MAATAASAMRRIAKAVPPPDMPDPFRGFAVALGKAGRTVGLPLRLARRGDDSGEAEAVLQQDFPDPAALIGYMEDAGAPAQGDWLIMHLPGAGAADGPSDIGQSGAGQSGILAIDWGLRAAAVEIQTMGRLLRSSDSPRPVTGTDVMLTRPLAASVLAHVTAALQGGVLESWVTGYAIGDRLVDLRAVEMALPDQPLRLLTIRVIGGAGVDPALDRAGTILIALPVTSAADDTVSEGVTLRWAEALQSVIGPAPATVDAVLHRMVLPLERVRQWRVGDNLPLHGANLASVRIEGPDRRIYARARLGQLLGQRAIRIEEPGAAELGQLPQVPRLAAGRPGGMMIPAPDEGEPFGAMNDDDDVMGDDMATMMAAPMAEMAWDMAETDTEEQGYGLNMTTTEIDLPDDDAQDAAWERAGALNAFEMPLDEAASDTEDADDATPPWMMPDSD